MVSRIYVNLSTMQDVKVICSASSNEIYNSKEQFRTAISNLDWNVKCEKDISVRAVRITYKLRSLNEALTRYSNFVDKAYFKYAALENYENKLDVIGDVIPYSPSAAANIVPSTNNSNEFDDKKKKKWWEYIIDFGSKGLKIVENYADVKVLNGSIADILGLTVTIAEVFRKGINSAKEAVVTLTKIAGKGLTALSKIFKDKIPTSLGSIVSLFSDIVKLETKAWDEALQSAGGVFASLGLLYNKLLKDNIVKQIVKEGFSKEMAKATAKDMLKTIGENTLAPLIAVGGMVTSLIGNVIEYSKDGITLNEFGHILSKTGLGGAASLAKYCTFGLINIDVNKTDQYLDAAGWNVNEFWENTNLPVWAKATGVVLTSPLTPLVGIGYMLGDSIRTVGDAFLPR